MRRRRYLWDAWNRDHITKHAVSVAEAESVVRGALPPYPRKIGEGKQLVWGRTGQGRLLQVIFVVKLPDEIDYESLSAADILSLDDDDAPRVYVIHARELNKRETSQYRRFK